MIFVYIDDLLPPNFVLLTLILNWICISILLKYHRAVAITSRDTPFLKQTRGRVALIQQFRSGLAVFIVL